MRSKSREAENTDAKKPKMAVHKDSPPGIELDGEAHVIPLEQRTKEDQEKARKGG
jgi:hypothetical protein